MLPLLQEATPVPEALPARPILEPDHGPIAWARVLAGAVLAFIGTVWAQTIRNYLSSMASYGSSFSSPFVTWQISFLVVLVGAGFAGSNTRSGLRHGVLVGILATIAIVIAQFKLGVAQLPSQEFLLDSLEMGPASGAPVGACLFISSAATFITAAIGGWLGGQVFPPMVKKRFRRYDN